MRTIFKAGEKVEFSGELTDPTTGEQVRRTFRGRVVSRELQTMSSFVLVRLEDGTRETLRTDEGTLRHI